MEVAVIHCGMTVDAFWSLSWYELGLYMAQANEHRELERMKIEAGWEQAALIAATVANYAGKVGPKKALKIKDFYDRDASKKKEEIKQQIMTPEEVDKLAAELNPNKLKKKRNGKQ